MTTTETAYWGPSPCLRRWMLIGVISMIVGMLIDFVDVTCEIVWPEVYGTHMWAPFFYAGVLPGYLVLFGYLRLARELSSAGLWRSNVGMMVCGVIGVFSYPVIQDNVLDMPDTADLSLGSLTALILLTLLFLIPQVLGVWRGIALLRLRRTLGTIGAVLGWFNILFPFLFLFCCAVDFAVFWFLDCDLACNGARVPGAIRVVVRILLFLSIWKRSLSPTPDHSETSPAHGGGESDRVPSEPQPGNNA